MAIENPEGDTAYEAASWIAQLSLDRESSPERRCALETAMFHVVPQRDALRARKKCIQEQEGKRRENWSFSHLEAPGSLEILSTLGVDKQREFTDMGVLQSREQPARPTLQEQGPNQNQAWSGTRENPAVPTKRRAKGDIKALATTKWKDSRRDANVQSAPKTNDGCGQDSKKSDNDGDKNNTHRHAPPTPARQKEFLGGGGFKTAAEEINSDQMRSGEAHTGDANPQACSESASKPFQCPIKTGQGAGTKGGKRGGTSGQPGLDKAMSDFKNQGKKDDDEPPFSETAMAKLSPNGEEIPQSVLELDRELVERVCKDICDRPRGITWDQIAGLDHVKSAVQEIAVWPMLKPELFRGARAVPRGMLLFGPPGTGKTLIGRAIASQCSATFFSISCSTLTSKWIGEGEKMVRALFTIASALQPSVIFVDEIDSLLSGRKAEGEHESSRRLKTEFMVNMEGISGDDNHRVLLIGATNRPQELDDAARRRLPKQLHVPLPCETARRDIVEHMMKDTKCALDEAAMKKLCEKTSGYSASDMKHLIREAARAPLRDIFHTTMDPETSLTEDQIRAVQLKDFKKAAKQVRPTVTEEEVKFHEEWDRLHGARALGNNGDGAGDNEDDDDDDW